MTAATPMMISQIGLVCLPAAGKAPVGRRRVSTKAQASTMNAAGHEHSKNQEQWGHRPEVNTVQIIRSGRQMGRGRMRSQQPSGRGTPGRPAGQRPQWWAVLTERLGWVLLPFSEPGRLAGPARQRPLAPLGQLVVAVERPGCGRTCTAPVARVDSEVTRPPLRHRANRPGSSRSASVASTPAPAAACTGLLVSKLAHLGPDINGGTHFRCHPSRPARRAGRFLSSPALRCARRPSFCFLVVAGGRVLACRRAARGSVLARGRATGGSGLAGRGYPDIERGFPAERLVDLQQHLLLPLGESGVG